MKIRITGTKQETEAAAEKLAEVFDVREVSTFRPNNDRTPGSKLGRVYVEAGLLGDDGRG